MKHKVNLDTYWCSDHKTIFQFNHILANVFGNEHKYVVAKTCWVQTFNHDLDPLP